MKCIGGETRGNCFATPYVGKAGWECELCGALGTGAILKSVNGETMQTTVNSKGELVIVLKLGQTLRIISESVNAHVERTADMIHDVTHAGRSTTGILVECRSTKGTTQT